MSADTDRAWCLQTFGMIRDGGVWGVPRSGLLFTKRGDGLVLTARMPWSEEIAEAVAEGRDVPVDVEALRAYQDSDFALIARKFEEAGIPVGEEV